MSEPILAGKRALVTGATSGIGRATALEFVAEGARVLGIGRDGERLEALAGQTDGKCQGLVVDLCDPEARQAAVDAAVSRLGGLDILVNAAGILETGTMEAADLDAFHRTMNINVGALYDLSRRCLPALSASRGNIVNVSSVAGTRAFPGVIAYCVSKAAVDQITRCAALELADRGVRVNAVNPGVVVTEIHRRGGMDEEAYAAFLERSKETHPIGRVGTCEEVAALIAFLASDRASWITGSTHAIDGGRAETCAR